MIKNLTIEEHYEKDGVEYTEAEAKRLIYDERIDDDEIAEYIDEVYEEIHIGGCTFLASDIIRKLDPIAFSMFEDDIRDRRVDDFEYDFGDFGFDFIEEEEEDDEDKKKRFYQMLYNDPNFHIENENFLEYVFEMLEDDDEIEYDLNDEEDRQEVFKKISEAVNDTIEWINYKVNQMYENDEVIVDFDFSFYEGRFTPNGEQNKEEFIEYITNRVFAYNKR